MDLGDIKSGAQTLIDYIDGDGADLQIIDLQIRLLRDRLTILKEDAMGKGKRTLELVKG